MNLKNIGEEIEESDSRDKRIRNEVDRLLNASMFGKAFEIIVALLSFLSSLAFIVLTYYDLRSLNPCCNEALNNFAEYQAEIADEIERTGDTSIVAQTEDEWMREFGNCEAPDPHCWKYYHNNRMPAMFQYVDIPVCMLYSIHYILNLYIAANRCQFFINSYNVV